MIWIFLSLAIGGILKGATGAGAPLVAIPVIALYHPEGVPFAVTVFVIPSLLANIWQAWAYRADLVPGPMVWLMVAAGIGGVLGGSWMLSALAPEFLSLIVAGGVLTYVGLRITRLAPVLSLRAGRILGLPVGLAAGILQGSSGISAPVTLTFFNALRLERPAFIATVSLFFVVLTLVQIPALMAFGLLDAERLAISAGAFAVLSLFLPVGAWLGRKLAASVFDRVILTLLILLALKLVAEVVLGFG
ncbi:MAG: sulfite exporter TauE/SafE family protein [Rhodobacteraceae bacterium]|nr:sulfite exporter TauE/SafE family protein [Paracoccaceae bacterium]